MSPDEILERAQWDTFWVPDDVTVVDRPELRYLSCARDVSYLNMVVRIHAPDARLAGLVDEVRQAHAGRRSRFMVAPLMARPALERALAAGGYAAEGRYRVSVIDTAASASELPAASGLRVERVLAMPALRDAVAVGSAAFEQQLADEGQLRSDLAHVLGDDPRVARFVAYDADGAPLSTGGMTVFRPLGFALLWGGATIVEGRGRGAYSAVLAARLALARRLGLGLAGLYADERTSAPIVARRGFVAHGVMTSWERPASSSPD